jgi:hypothetical protein
MTNIRRVCVLVTLALCVAAAVAVVASALGASELFPQRETACASLVGHDVSVTQRCATPTSTFTQPNWLRCANGNVWLNYPIDNTQAFGQLSGSNGEIFGQPGGLWMTVPTQALFDSVTSASC